MEAVWLAFDNAWGGRPSALNSSNRERRFTLVSAGVMLDTLRA